MELAYIDMLIRNARAVYAATEGDDSLVMARDDYRVMANALVQLRERIAALEAERADLIKINNKWAGEWDAMREERNALKQDAERYRWLRDADHERIIFAAHYERSSAASSTVDAAIDAAREKP